MLYMRPDDEDDADNTDPKDEDFDAARVSVKSFSSSSGGNAKQQALDRAIVTLLKLWPAVEGHLVDTFNKEYVGGLMDSVEMEAHLNYCCGPDSEILFKINDAAIKKNVEEELKQNNDSHPIPVQLLPSLEADELTMVVDLFENERGDTVDLHNFMRFFSEAWEVFATAADADAATAAGNTTTQTATLRQFWWQKLLRKHSHNDRHTRQGRSITAVSNEWRNLRTSAYVVAAPPPKPLMPPPPPEPEPPAEEPEAEPAPVPAPVPRVEAKAEDSEPEPVPEPKPEPKKTVAVKEAPLAPKASSCCGFKLVVVRDGEEEEKLAVATAEREAAVAAAAAAAAATATAAAAAAAAAAIVVPVETEKAQDKKGKRGAKSTTSSPDTEKKGEDATDGSSSRDEKSKTREQAAKEKRRGKKNADAESDADSDVDANGSDAKDAQLKSKEKIAEEKQEVAEQKSLLTKQREEKEERAMEKEVDMGAPSERFAASISEASEERTMFSPKRDDSFTTPRSSSKEATFHAPRLADNSRERRKTPQRSAGVLEDLSSSDEEDY